MDASMMKWIFVVLFFGTTIGKSNGKKNTVSQTTKLYQFVSSSTISPTTELTEASNLATTSALTNEINDDNSRNVVASPTFTTVAPIIPTTTPKYPHCVKDLKVSATKDNSISSVNVTFQYPGAATDSIDHFEITYEPLNNTKSSTKCQSIKPYENTTGITVPFEKKTTFTRVIPVTADTQYQLTVKAFNGNRNSIRTINFTKQAKAPDQVTELNVTEITSSSAQVQWSPPRYPKGNILAYEVRVENNNRSCTVKLMCSENEENNVQQSPECQLLSVKGSADPITENQVIYRLNGLTAYTNYSVDVLVINSYGKGCNSTKHFKTSESAPESVQSLMVVAANNNSSQAEVTFNCPHTSNGKITYYWIMYKALNNTDTTNLCQTINPTENKTGKKVKAKGIHPCSYSVLVPVTADTLYLFEVFAMDMYNGSSANKTYFAEGRASDPVSDLNVTNVTSTNATVHWSPPIHSNGNLLAYEVALMSNEGCCRVQLTCKGNEDNNHEMSSECELFRKNIAGTFSDNQVTYELNRLKPYTEYSVDISVINSYGKSDTESKGFKTSESAPESVQSLMVVAANNNSSQAEVTFNCPHTSNGKITYYWIMYKALNNTDTTNLCQTVNPTENKTGKKVKAKGIHPCSYSVLVPVTADTLYLFEVFAMDMYNGSSANKTYFAEGRASDPVSDLNVTNVTSTNATVHWSPPIHSNGNLLAYEVALMSNEGCCRVQLTCKGNEDNNHEMSSECELFRKNIAGTFSDNQVTYELNRLKPYTEYSVDISVINSYGKSDTESKGFKTSESEPGKVTNLTITSIVGNYTAVTVSFSSPLKPNGAIKHYMLSYHMLSQRKTSPACEVLTQITNRTGISIQSKDNGLYSVAVDVSPETTYTFQVTAFNSLRGTPAKTEITTGSTVPGPMKNLQIQNRTSSSVIVTWKPPTQPNGFLLGYRLRLNRMQPNLDVECYQAAELSCNGEKISDLPTEAWCDTDRITDARLNVPNPFSYQFTNLSSGTLFQLLGVAVNSHGSGNESRLQFNTAESEPGKVRNLRVTPLDRNYTAVTVSFSSPKNPNGVITHYMLSYFMLSPGHTHPACEVLKQITNNTDIQIQAQLNYTGLLSKVVKVSPETKYFFKVTAFNSLNGIPTEKIYTTGSNVSGPIQDLHINNITSDSVLVTWKPPSEPNGFLMGYRLKLNIFKPDIDEDCYIAAELSCKGEKIRDVSRKSWKEGKKCGTTPSITYFKHNGGLHNLNIADLLSYTFYNVSVVPLNTNGSGTSEDTSFMTNIGVPDEPNDFRAITSSSATITLLWSPSEHKAGPTNYSIVVDGNVDHRTNNCTVVEVINVTGYNISSEVVADLCSYTYYNFSIIASTSAGNSSRVPTNQTVRTGTGIPTAPRNLFAISVSPYTVNLTWTPSEHKAGTTCYLIEVKGELNQGSDIFTNIKSLPVKGFSNTNLVVQDLLSYTNYEFVIRARTTAGESNTTDTAVRTQSKAADPPYSLRVKNVTPISVELSWMPSKHQCGLTDYIVDVEEQSHLRADFYIPNRTIRVHGFHNNTVYIGNLISYWKYNVSVRATTSVHPNSSSIFAEIQTLQSRPGRVKNIRVSALPDNYTAVNLTWECPEERDRHGPISSFIVQYSDKNVTFDHFPDGEPCTRVFQSAVLPVHPEQTYEFTVFASAKYEGLKTVPVSFSAKAGKPLKENSTKLFLITTSETTTDSTFPVTVNTDLLRDSTNGHIVMIGLLVMKDTAIVDVPNNITWNSLKSWRGWKEWKENYKGTYRPTPDNWLIPQIRRKRSTDSGSNSTTRFIVGNDNCESKEDVHCNGPVEADTTYRVIAVSCTNAGCSSSTPFGPFRTKAKSVVAAVVGGLFAALVVVGIVIGGLLYRRQRNRKGHHHGDDPKKREEGESVNKKRPKKLCDFSKLVDEYHKDSERLFSLEWQEIDLHSPSHPYQNATLEVNRVKNRYTNILAYDHTRVKLLPKTEDEGSDYINANFILGFSRPGEYIASQGPVPATVDDFWQMIWEQNVPIIVQLTDLYEGGRRKLSRYWPDEVNAPETFGEVKVETVSLSPMNKYTIKVLKVSLGSKSRQVKHFFLQGWQDYNANLKTGDVIDFARYVRNELKPTDKGPMVVHCSAGVGRTGTFICVDYFLQVIDKAELDDSIDIFSFVLKMRDYRPLMVQSESQYIFVHDAVKEMIERKKKALAGVDEVLYENQAYDPEDDEEDNIYENT